MFEIILIKKIVNSYTQKNRIVEKQIGNEKKGNRDGEKNMLIPK